MPCIRIGKGHDRGIVCFGNEPIAFKHNGQTFCFEWTAASGWCPMNKDGTQRLSRVPMAVWDKLDAAYEAAGRDWWKTKGDASA